MASGTNIFLASALAAAARAGWAQYKQWKLNQIPEEDRAEYIEQQEIRSDWLLYRLPYYVFGVIIVIGLIAAAISYFY